MIHPRQQWCIQVEITNACNRRCSNCTRMLAHARKPFRMDVPTFERAVRAVKYFPTESARDLRGRRKVIGMMGGEPLLHPDFSAMVDVMCDHIPMANRGLWTGLDYRQSKHRATVEKLLGPEPSTSVKLGETAGYLNYNPHFGRVEHQPVLVAVSDVIHDPVERDRLIANCWIQEQWASAITPKGFFFCEVAAAFDMIFGGGGGFPIDDGSWRFDIGDYFTQIEKWCPRCGVCVPLPGRADSEAVDDVSRSNLDILLRLGSPRIKHGNFVLFESDSYQPPEKWKPETYIKGK